MSGASRHFAYDFLFAEWTFDYKDKWVIKWYELLLYLIVQNTAAIKGA